MSPFEMNNTSIGARIPDRFFVRGEDSENETCNCRRNIRGYGACL